MTHDNIPEAWTLIKPDDALVDQRIVKAKRELRARSIDGVQRRTFTTRMEVRAAGDSWQIVGLGIVYNSLSENLGGFREEIASGAATEVLATNPDVRGLFNHNPDLVLGRTLAGTMALEEVAGGVQYTLDPPATSYAEDLRISLERGDVTQSSFAFRVARGGDQWFDDEETGGLIRRVLNLSGLYDMSPVTYAAYEATTSGVRSNPAPSAERSDDEHAVQRVNDGGTQDRQADVAPAGLPNVGMRQARLRSRALGMKQ